MNSSSKQKFVIIDGNALLHRAFHALPPLTTKQGMLVNAVYGFALTFLKVLKELKPAYMAVAFDTKAPTFRDNAYEDYKAQRITQPQELYDQIPLIKDMLHACHVAVVEKDGFEADDVIGTLAFESLESKAKSQKLADGNIEVIIVTGDLDALQLVNEHTKVYTFRKGFSDTMIYDEDAVKERFGISPAQMIDYKALRGDPSDNIPGVRGIGEKTATELLKQFKTLDKVYQTLDSPKAERMIKPAVREKLKKGEKDAKLSKMLATIVADAPLEFSLSDAKLGAVNTQKLVSLFREWGFQSLVSKIPSAAIDENRGTVSKETNPRQKTQGALALHNAPKPQKREWKEMTYTLVDTEEKLDEFLKLLRVQKHFTVDTETTSLDPFNGKLLGVSFSWEKGKACYVAITKIQETSYKQLKTILEDPKIEKYGHNVKFDLEVLRTAGIHAQGFTFDTMIASYLLNPGSRQHNLDTVVFTEFGHQMQPIEELIGKGKSQISLKDVSLKDVSNYSCEDADFTNRLIVPFRKRLTECDNLSLFEDLEMPLIPILADMEEAGVKIDTAFMKKLTKKVSKELKKLKGEIYKIAGQNFNINSPQQLKEVLFEKLQLSTAGIGKTKTGISTAAGELEKLKDTHAIIPLIMEYRELFKLLTTYLEALPEQVDPATGRVHTDYNQTVTATGRLSSSNPNLQNIPIRTELGREIRKAFIAEHDFQLIAADYSQIELRIAATVANDSAMLTSFKRNEDIHRRTASNVLGVPYDDVTPEQRRNAKAINFGILYGLGARGLAQSTGLTQTQAKDFIDRYFRVHKGIKQFIDATIATARDTGYVETLFGRRRYLPEITAEHQGLRAQAERMAVNHPIQGTQADLIKKAMIQIDERLQKEFNIEKYRTHARPVTMLMQVHDELVFEVRNDLVKKVTHIVTEEMTRVMKLKVPIEVHVGVGDNWDQCK